MLKMPVYGAHPSDDDYLRFSKSKAFNVDEGVFENRRAHLFSEMREGSSIIEMTKEWFSERKDGSPSTELPQRQPGLKEFLKASDQVKFIWFGHSTFLVNISGTIILIDPVFSNTAAPVSFTAKRFQPPVLTLEELPRVDVLLISHDHYDHLEMDSITFFKESETEFVAPLGVGLHLTRWGVEPSRITERDWWESYTTNGIEFTAAPAQHFSGRDGINNNETLWASWSIVALDSNQDQKPGARLFFSGDSGYDTHFSEIGERLGPFDLAFMENGQYDEGWLAVHMLPNQTLQAFKDVKAKRLLPIHWGMFELAFHTWYDPVESLNDLAVAEGIELVTPIMGEIIELDDSLQSEKWWQPLL
jgi:L-ascorbate metabolism protein UlaG (beta-lactamase superfamily)